MLMKHTLLFASVLLAGFSVNGLAQDAPPPQLSAFSFEPTSVETTSDPATVTVHFTLTGRSAGIVGFETAFVDPSGVSIQRASRSFAPAPSVSGSVTVTLPAFGTPGTWRVGSVFVSDAAGNTLSLDTDAISSAGFPTNLQVLSAVDSTPPNLTALSLSPDSIDTTAAPAEVKAHFTATDDFAGAKFLELSLLSPSGSETRRATVNLTPAKTVTGAVTFAFPRFSEAGIWTVASAYLADAAGNTLILDVDGLVEKGFPTTLTVMSSRDTTPPQLVALSFTPASIDTAAANLVLSFQVTDDLSGATTFQAALSSPSGSQTLTASASFAAQTSVAGKANITFPKDSEPGNWTVTSVFLSDAVGNTAILTGDDLAGLGFPAQVGVTNTGDTSQP
ncbi:MAG: hypothetical protein ABSH47_25655 [Bryobacteraceae bacterium]|jgi:hypothetical protein